jgi:hypothetical protein
VEEPRYSALAEPTAARIARAMRDFFIRISFPFRLKKSSREMLKCIILLAVTKVN